jgi:putative transposase
LARVYGERERSFVGQYFWARRYFVSVGRDEAVIREYIKSQEKEDERLDQLGLWPATGKVAHEFKGRVSDPHQRL